MMGDLHLLCLLRETHWGISAVIECRMGGKRSQSTDSYGRLEGTSADNRNTHTRIQNQVQK